MFPSWGVPMVEADGDYRKDAWLEQKIGGPLYEHQQNLPRLPVPSLEDTLTKFVPTALPLAESESERQALLQAVEAFPTQAKNLQERLQQRAQDPEWKDSSWLQPWWNKLAYLQFRETVMINVSYFFDFKDDPKATTNVTRGAALLTAAGQFRKLVCSGQWPAEQVGRGDKRKPLCSTAYKYMFHACRIPVLEEDTYRIYDPSLHHHAIVARKGHFFKIGFCDPTTGEPYSLEQLEEALETCIQQAEQLETETSPYLPKLGWLTSQHRDEWAKARTALLEFGGPRMEEALATMESGALILCLDDEKVVSRKESSSLYLYGGESSGDNRWFDKSLTVSVTDNGKAGFLGEHSMMDGMPVVSFANHLTQQTYDKCQNATAARSTTPLVVEPVFGQDLIPAIRQAADLVEMAKAAHAEMSGKHELFVQTFHGFGGTFMKKSGCSPDAFVQMAIQLATYRLWGKQAGTYESAQVRPFLHGRTEVARGVSAESAAFCEKMGLVPQWNDTETFAEKSELFEKAVVAHVKYIGKAAQALGVDRHFFGLSMLANDDPLPDLFADPTFQRSKHWRVSTSHLTHPRFENWGYGEVVPDGVGLSYSIHPRHCVFNITSLKEHAWSDKLSQLLEDSLLEIRRILEAKEDASNPDADPKSRL